MKKFRTLCTAIVALILLSKTAVAQTMSIKLSGNDPTCSYSKDGNCTASITGGTPPFFYEWSNGEKGANKNTIVGLGNAKYSVTVTDNNNVKADTSILLQRDSIAIKMVVMDASCGNNGSINVNVSGGILPFQYQWNTGVTSSGNTINGLSAGTYVLTITDANGCSGNSIAFVKVKDTIAIEMIVTDGSCDGSVDGSITPNVTGGTPPYQYLWSDGSTTIPATHLSYSGTYVLIVVDANGCSKSAEAVLKGKMTFGYDIVNISTQNPTGKITIKNIIGGKAPYEFTVSSKKGFFLTTQNTVIDVPFADVYTITVKDSEGCTSQLTVRVLSDNELFLTSSSYKSDCKKPTGRSSINYINGSPPMTYLWSNGATTFSANNLGIGKYFVTVTDSKGIKGIDSVEVLGKLNLDFKNEIPCNGLLATSTIQTLSGGQKPYSYLWSNGATTTKISNLVTGNYHITVNDANGCKDTSYTTIRFDSTLQAQIIINHEKCPILEVEMLNGTAPYSYLWNNNETTASISVYKNNASLFTVSITDSKGCVGKTQTNYSSVSYTPKFDLITCGNVARVVPKCDLSVPNFIYKWSNGSTNSFIKNVPLGSYSVLVLENGYNNNGKTAFCTIDGLNPCAQFIEGQVLLDDKNNCKKDSNETRLQERMVEITPGPTYVKTDKNGEFIAFLNDGDYTLNVISPNPYDSMCFPNTKVSLKDSAKVDLVVKNEILCPFLTVDVTTPRLRRCFDNIHYVKYCNTGTAIAKNAYIKLELDKDLKYKNASIPLTSQIGNSLVFNLGDVKMNECKTFHFTAELSCTGTVLGQTHCVEAHIYPDSLCLSEPQGWSKAKVETQAVCTGNQITLSLKNTGAAPMAVAKNYIIIEDQVLYKTGTFKLNSNEILEIKMPANGKTYRIEAEQETGFPLTPSKPSAWVEACGTNGQGGVSTGFVPMFGNNSATPFTAIDCQQSRGSYDPNLKSAYPIGYESSHFIPQNEDLEYTIQFQNEGTDTAFTVVLRDTLSNLLNINTLRMGASSHPYEWTLEGKGILKVTYKNILLPTKKENEAASQGFVSFRIAQKNDNPLGSLLKNRAGIYFDFNEVILTNEVFHTLGKNFIHLIAVKNANTENVTIKVYPNPTDNEATFSILGIDNQAIELNIFDLTGRLVRQEKHNSSSFQFRKEALLNGIYLYQIKSEGKVLANGRMSIF